MPRIATEVDSFSVHRHTFRFISPAMTIKYGIPNPCISCHKDKSNQWALDQLAKWQNESPWRFEKPNRRHRGQLMRGASALRKFAHEE